jgi:hypothetical protein
LLTRLRTSGLEFVIIGGVSVVYHGAPMDTFDLDICCAFGEQNVRRIETAVSDLHPVHRLTPQQLPLAATQSSFASLKNLYLQTDLGKLIVSERWLASAISRPYDHKAAWQTFPTVNFMF